MNFNDKFCYELSNSSIDINRCIEYLKDEKWYSLGEEFDEKFSGHHGIGLTATSDSSTPHLDSFTPYQDISRKPDIVEKNWQLLTTPTESVRGYMKEVFDRFKFIPHRARFAKIDPGQKIGMHVDTYMENMTRVHWPIITDPEAYMLGYNEDTRKIDRYNFEVEKCYVINTNVVHGVINRSSISRIHLIVNFDISFEELKKHKEYGLFI
jgi:hypothetical protein